MSNISTIAGKIGSLITYGLDSCVCYDDLSTYFRYDYLCRHCPDSNEMRLKVTEYTDQIGPTTTTCPTLTVTKATESCTPPLIVKL